MKMKRLIVSSVLALLVIGSMGLLSMRASLAAPQATASPMATPVYAPAIDPANFVTSIDNPFFPLQPGTTFVYEGKSEKGNEHNEVYVSTDTKVIMGVTCAVISDTVTVDGGLAEMTLDWYAQDKQGNVWYFGEDAKEYEDGKVVSTAGSWQAGVDGAQPGIIMEARPKVGDSYRQEYYKGKAEDMAEVLSLTESVPVTEGSYTNVLKTREWSALEPKLIEHKYYASGVGFIMVSTPDGIESLKLVDVRQEQEGEQNQDKDQVNQGDEGDNNEKDQCNQGDKDDNDRD